MALGIPLDNIFKAMAVRLDGTEAAGISLNINLDFTDLTKPGCSASKTPYSEPAAGSRKLIRCIADVIEHRFQTPDDRA